jgi:hypothetical protein
LKKQMSFTVSLPFSGPENHPCTQVPDRFAAQAAGAGQVGSAELAKWKEMMDQGISR